MESMGYAVIFAFACANTHIALANTKETDMPNDFMGIVSSESTQHTTSQKPFGLHQAPLENKTSNAPIDVPIIENYKHSLGVSYLQSYMHNHSFDINLYGVSLQYTHATNVYRSMYQLNIAHTKLTPSLANEALHIGAVSIFDIAFAQRDSGGGILGLEVGYGAGIPNTSYSNAQNQFNESSLLINIDLGYVFRMGYVLLYPYTRLEQYIFFPHKRANPDPIDYGLNALFGLKFIGDNSLLDWWMNVALMSDFNASGNGVGVLADKTIVYDRDGMSNGALFDVGANILNQKAFALKVYCSLSYAFSYFEVQLKSGISGIWQF